MDKAPEFQIIGSKGWVVMHTGDDHIYLAHPESKPIILKREGQFWSIEFVEILNMAPYSEDYVGKQFRREMMGLGEPS